MGLIEQRGLRAVGRDVAAGLVASLLPLVNAFTFAALIFSGPFVPMLNQGVAVLLVSGAVTAIVVAAGSRFRAAIAGPVSLTSALLAAVLVRLAPAMDGLPQAVVAGTALAALGAATLATAGVLFVLGTLRLGKMVRFTPYPVIAGFMGATGWVMSDAAVRVTTGVGLELRALPVLADGRELALLAGMAGFAAVLFALTRRFRHPLAVPIVLAGAVAIVDAAIWMAGLSFGQAREAGILFDVVGAAAPAVPMFSGALAQADWAAVWHVAPSMAPVVVVGVVQALMTAAALEVALDVDADLDRELRLQGLANVASALAGGIVGVTSTTYTSAAISAEARGRAAGVVVALVMLAALGGGAAGMALVPRFVPAGFLLMLGLRLLWQWGVAIRRVVAPWEWLLIAGMIVVTAAFGLMPALLASVVGSCVLLAVSLSRFGIVRHSYGLDEATSTLQRSQGEMEVLRQRGAAVQVLELGGLLFFGTTHQLMRQVRTSLAVPPMRILVLDFVAVIGVDSAAAAALARISGIADQAGVRLIVSGVRPAVAPLLAGIGEAVMRRCGTLDEALELAESLVLAGASPIGADPPAERWAWLEPALGSRENARLLQDGLAIAAYAPGEVLCRQGDDADTLYFVESGRIRVTVAEADGTTVRMRVFGPHTVAGELGFFLGAGRSATMDVEQSAWVGQLSREAFQMLGAAHPQAALALLAYVAAVQAERLAFSTRQIVALRKGSA